LWLDERKSNSMEGSQRTVLLKATEVREKDCTTRLRQEKQDREVHRMVETDKRTSSFATVSMETCHENKITTL
jgi:hypothetical protein